MLLGVTLYILRALAAVVSNVPLNAFHLQDLSFSTVQLETLLFSSTPSQTSIAISANGVHSDTIVNSNNKQTNKQNYIATMSSIPHTNGDSVKRTSNGEHTPSVRAPGEPIINVQPPRREDLQPSYAQVIKPDTEDASGTGWYGGMINTLGSAIGTLGAIPCCLCCPNPYKPVDQGNVGLVTKFGRFARAVDPGLVKINPLSESLTQVDVKIQIVGKC